MPNSSRLSSRSRPARWISAVPFDWMPTAMPEPERRAPSWPMKATSLERRTRTIRGSAPSSRTPATSCREHVSVREAADRLGQSARERRAHRDHDLVRIVAENGNRELLDRGSRCPAPRRPGVRRSRTAAPAAAASARPRAGSRCPGPRSRSRRSRRRRRCRRRATIADGLQVVRRDPLALQLEDRRGDLREPALVQRPRDVESAQAFARARGRRRRRRRRGRGRAGRASRGTSSRAAPPRR